MMYHAIVALLMLCVYIVNYMILHITLCTSGANGCFLTIDTTILSFDVGVMGVVVVSPIFLCKLGTYALPSSISSL